ncbi:MAG: hypothetical protein C5B49_07395 [Bdellovibrio sp.]|nr:MAG: hypothetical protein C5B49_07395 [Bdellovibrio sp.]
MTPHHPLGQSVGIWGGGQLARMLALSAHELGLEPWILSKDADDPAAQVSSKWIKDAGRSSVAKMLKQVSVLTFESEFHDLRGLPDATGVFRPPLAAMAELQDRRTQKQWLVSSHIPTSPFVPVDRVSDLSNAQEQIPGKCVLKKAQGGYDGYGTFVMKNASAWEEHRRHWQGPYIAEAFVPFVRELALILVRSSVGEFRAFPLVESVQKNSKCDLVKGPVRHARLDVLLVKFERLMRQLDYVGALGVELFDTGQELLVNEIAPRVHNSGHYSQNYFLQSQFHYHWKALLGEPLPEPQPTGKYFVMANLVGESHRPMRLPPGLRGALHWYGKKENRPGRKMGHLNYVGDNLESLLRLAHRERKQIRK